MDTSHLDPSKFYLVSGKTLSQIQDRQDRLWAGDNIQRGPGIYRRGSGTGGYSLAARGGGGQAIPSTPSISAWPWEVTNTTINSGATHTPQVQVGGNGFLAALNAFVSNVSGSPTNVQPYPQIAVSGNGYIYALATPATAGTASPLTSLDCTYQSSVQAQDTSNPAAFYWMLLATITGYATDGVTGNITFNVDNQYGSGYGPSTLYYCAGSIAVY